MKKYEVERCSNLLNFLENDGNVSYDDIDTGIDICTYFRGMINDMHNGVSIDKLDLKIFSEFLSGNEELVYDLENRVNELISQHLLEIFNLYQIFESGVYNDKVICDNLPFRNSNINVEKLIFSKLFDNDSISDSYQSLIDALIFNIYDRKLYDLDMKAILKLDKYIVDNNIDYDYFDKDKVKEI